MGSTNTIQVFTYDHVAAVIQPKQKRRGGTRVINWQPEECVWRLHPKITISAALTVIIITHYLRASINRVRLRRIANIKIDLPAIGKLEQTFNQIVKV